MIYSAKHPSKLVLVKMVSILFVLFLQNPIKSQSISIINYLNPQLISLTSHQDSMLSIIKRDSFSEGYRLINILNLASSQDSGIVKVGLPFLQCGNTYFQAKYVNFDNDSNYFWGGLNVSDSSLFCDRGYFTLTRLNGNYVGKLMVGDSFYHIQDLGGGIQVLGKENSDLDSGWCATTVGNHNVTNRGAGEECNIKVTKF